MRTLSSKIMAIFMLSLMFLRVFPSFAQDADSFVFTERALRNAIIEICYGSRVLVDLLDPDKTYVSLEEAGLDDETANELIADAAETDGSYGALSDLLIDYCLGDGVAASIWLVYDDPAAVEVILVDAGVEEYEEFYILVYEYVYFEQWVYTYFESYSFTEEQYTAIFFTMEFSSSFELSELLIEYGVEESEVSEFVDSSEEMIDNIESEDPTDSDEDGILDIEDEDDDEDGIADDEDSDSDGDGVEDADEDDDSDNDGVDDEDDTDDDEDGIDDSEDEDADGDGVDDDDADGDGELDEEDADDDGDGVDDSEDSDDDGDGSDEGEDDSMVDDGDDGGDDGGDE